MKFNPNQTEIRAKNSSLAIEIQVDEYEDFKFYVYNRRNHSIVAFYRIPLMQHCREALLERDPIIRKKHKKPSKK